MLTPDEMMKRLQERGAGGAGGASRGSGASQAGFMGGAPRETGGGLPTPDEMMKRVQAYGGVSGYGGYTPPAHTQTNTRMYEQYKTATAPKRDEATEQLFSQMQRRSGYMGNVGRDASRGDADASGQDSGDDTLRRMRERSGYVEPRDIPDNSKTYAQMLAESQEVSQRLEQGAVLPDEIPKVENIGALIHGSGHSTGGTVNPRMTPEAMPGNYQHMTEREAAVYKYYKDAGEEKKAKEYLKSLELIVNQRAGMKSTEDSEALAKEHGGAALFARGAANIGGVAGALYMAGVGVKNTLTGGNEGIDPYHPLLGAARVQEGTSAGFTGELDGFGKIVADTGLAVFDFATNQAVAAAVGMPAIAPYMMAAGAAGSAGSDAMLRGATTQESLQIGAIAGVAEAVTERMGFHRLMRLGEIGSRQGVRAALRQIVPNMVGEGLEESTTEVINILADSIILGERSNFAQIVEQGMAQGMTEGEATRTALLEAAKQVGYSGVVGGLSGGVISGGISGMNRVTGRNVLEGPTNEAGIRESGQEQQTPNPTNSTNSAGMNTVEVNSTETNPAEEQVRKTTRDYGDKWYSENGSEAFQAEAERRGDLRFADAFETAYRAGITGQMFSAIEQTAHTVTADRAVMTAAYLAGVKDSGEEIAKQVRGESRFRSEKGVELRSGTATRAQMAFANLMSETTGAKVVIVDKIAEGVNGMYETKKGIITVALDSETFTGTLFHEVVHYIRDVNEEGFQNMRQKVFEMVANAEAHISQYNESYSGTSVTTMDGITAEMTADAFQMLMSDERRAKEFIRTMRNENPTVLAKIKEFIESLLEMLEGLLADNRYSPFAQDINKDIENTKALQKIFVQEARVAREMAEGREARSEEIPAAYDLIEGAEDSEASLPAGTPRDILFSIRETDDFDNVTKIQRQTPNEAEIPAIKRAYMEAIDINLLKFINRVKNGEVSVKEVYHLKSIEGQMAEDISQLVGFDVQGYKNQIRINAIEHIEKRHGISGIHDKSMSKVEDIARIQHVLNHYDSIGLEKRRSKAYSDRDGKLARMVVFEKRINGTYYIVEAVPDTKSRTLEIVTAFQKNTKKEGTQPTSVTSPPDTSKTATAMPSTNNISPKKENDNKSNENEILYSIKYTQDNVPFVEVTENILAGVAKKDWVKTVTSTLKERFPDGVQVGNNVIRIDMNSRRELTFSKYMSWLIHRNPKMYRDKLKAAANADEILLASGNYVNEGLLHERDDRIRNFARGTVLLRVGRNDYTAEVIVSAKAKGSMTLYDVINLEETEINEKKKALDNADSDITSDNSIGRSESEPSNNKKIAQKRAKIKGKKITNEELFSRHTRDVSLDVVLNENSRLKEMVDSLKKQFERVEHDRNSAESAARKILEKYESDYDIDAFVDKFEALVDYVVSSGAEVDMVQVMKALEGLAYDALQESRSLNTTLSDRHEELKRTIRNTTIKVTSGLRSELEYMGGYNNVRRDNFGRMHFSTEGGKPIADLMMELWEAYPEFFQNSEVEASQQVAPRTEGDMLIEVISILDSLTPTYENPYGMNMEEVAADVAYELWESYFQVQQQKPILAEREREALERERAKYQNLLAENRKESKQKMAQMEKKLEEVQKDSRRKLTLQEIDYRMRLARNKEMYQKRKDRQEYAKYRGITEKVVKRLKKWIEQPTDKYHVPKDMLSGVVVLLDKLQFSDPEIRLSAYDVTRAKKELAALGQEGSDGIYIQADQQVLNYLEEFASAFGEGVYAKDLTTEQMRRVSVIVRGISASITKANTLLSVERAAPVSAVAGNYIAAVSDRGAVKQNNRLRLLWDMLNVNMLDARSFFKEMSDEVGNTIYRGLREGFDRKIRHVAEAQDFMETVATTKQMREWRASPPQRFEVNGGAIELTMAQVMSLYCLARRPAAQRHILTGGIKSAPSTQFKGKAKRALEVDPVSPASEAQIKQITDTLTAEQKAAADKIQGFLTAQTAAWGNETSMLMFGYEKFLDPNYFPIVSDGNYLNTLYGDANTKAGTLQNMGVTKSVNRYAKNPIMVEDIFSVFVRQVDQMSSYNAFVPALSDMNKFFNYKQMPTETGGKIASVRSMMERTMGPAGIKYAKELMERINGIAKKDDMERLPRMFLRNMKIAAVGANVRVVLQQPASYLRAMEMIDPQYLTQAMFAGRADYEKIYAFAPIAQWKAWGYYEMNVGRSMESLLVGSTGIERIQEASMAPAGWADKITWGRIWKAVELETRKKHPELAGDALNERIGARFSEIVDETQVVDSTIHRSQMGRSVNLLPQMATSFMSEPIKTYNIFRNALVQYVRNPSKETGSQVARTVLVLAANGIGVSMAAGFADMMRDDDEERDLMEKWLAAVRGDYSEAETPRDYIMAALASNLGDNFNPLNYIPYARDVMSTIQGFTVQRTDMAWLVDITRIGNRWMKYMDGESPYTLQVLLIDTAGALSKMTGLAIGNVKRDLFALKDSIINYTCGIEAKYENSRWTYDIGASGNANRYVKMIMDARMSGQTTLATRIYNDMVKEGVSNENLEKRISPQEQGRIKEEPEAMQAVEARRRGNIRRLEAAYDALEEKGYTAKEIKAATDSLYNAQKPKEESVETFNEIDESRWDTGGTTKPDYELAVNAFLYGGRWDYEAAKEMIMAGGTDDATMRNNLRRLLKTAYQDATARGNYAEMKRIEKEYEELNGKVETLRN